MSSHDQCVLPSDWFCQANKISDHVFVFSMFQIIKPIVCRMILDIVIGI